MKRILATLLIGITVSVLADEQKMAGLSAPDDIFVITVEPYPMEMKGYLTPNSLLQALAIISAHQWFPHRDRPEFARRP